MDAWDCFRGLAEELSQYEGSEIFAGVLEPWLSAHPEARDWLVCIAQRPGTPIPPIDDEESWALYALNRTLDTLIAAGNPVSPAQYIAFVEALGMKALKPQQFSPFYHEVDEIEQGPAPASPVAILEFNWPCVMLGNMMVSRARVRVSAGAQVLAPGIADASTLYWTFWRKNRPNQDLSHGWGSNSQWRTAFRRDFALGDTYYYNVDGKKDIATQGDDEESELTQSERIELLTHRCFVRCTKPHNDLWPYDDRFVEQRKAGLLSRLIHRLR
ncbi:hypothetical protein [Duganella sp. Root1480D1]|uniref:hypothetical protein n=1 Tax=Duganella sp. Root1480D1 TaxID=1736471 RepID=UPI00070C3997|nr:hypothetical protein [Duganella sp. Root1480D1]KQZ43305.1 hypothetical protein ASD58_21735 [Duganella sp. Root1480D1]